MGLFLASFICLVFVKLNSCSSYMEGWLGFAPVYVVETAVVVGGAYLYMPKNPRFQDRVLTVRSLLQASCRGPRPRCAVARLSWCMHESQLLLNTSGRPFRTNASR